METVEGDHQVEGDFKVDAVVSQLNDLTTNIYELEDQCRSQGKYITHHTRKKYIIMIKVVLGHTSNHSPSNH